MDACMSSQTCHFPIGFFEKPLHLKLISPLKAISHQQAQWRIVKKKTLMLSGRTALLRVRPVELPVLLLVGLLAVVPQLAAQLVWIF